MPEKAKVIIVDDNKELIDTLLQFLIYYGHNVVGIAGTVNEALAAKKRIEDLDVALIDGDLSERSQGGKDGAKVAEAFRGKFPDIKILSISANSQSWSDDTLSIYDGFTAIAQWVTLA